MHLYLNSFHLTIEKLKTFQDSLIEVVDFISTF